MAAEPVQIEFEFDHVHMYMKNLGDLESYTATQDLFTKFDNARDENTTIEEGRAIFEKLGGKPREHQSYGLDVVEQVITGFAMRVRGHRYGASTNSVIMTSRDPSGAKFVITAPNDSPDDAAEPLHFFKSAKVQQFFDSHNGKQGIAVLCFRVPSSMTETILANYTKHHPLLVTPEGLTVTETEEQTVKTIEIFAYYNKAGDGPDLGTRLRFIDSSIDQQGHFLLPGLNEIPAEYPDRSVPFYSDHWVSNVFNRESFLKNLEDSLGFTPKVNFNAGVVGAGEAVIESTVTGNEPRGLALTRDNVLADQTQVYLPINNALSPVGHVNMFLEQLGQGVQHIASRVPSMVESISNANISRQMTGYGFNFLNIPRSYYGTLSKGALIKQADASEKLADAVLTSLIEAGLCTFVGEVDMDITTDKIKEVASKWSEEDLKEEFNKKSEKVCEVVSKSRYVQLYLLLRDHVDEETYLHIVRNKILVDIQGNDILYQIFTGNILNESIEDEAPFLEFIERVCSKKCDAEGNPLPVRPGCGGFGIRNFLTLFLSIEVSKAMKERLLANKEGDKKKEAMAIRMVEVFTEQLNESNPILTSISDAMTEESDILSVLKVVKDEKKKVELERSLGEQIAIKDSAQGQLKETGTRYKLLMRQIREDYNRSCE